jgi:hypothetical protein
VRELVIAGLVVALVALVLFRQRRSPRDPARSVERNRMRPTDAGSIGTPATTSGWKDLAGGGRRDLVQARDGRRRHLECLRGMARLAEANLAPTLPPEGTGDASMAETTSAPVAIVDGDRWRCSRTDFRVSFTPRFA